MQQAWFQALAHHRHIFAMCNAAAAITSTLPVLPNACLSSPPPDRRRAGKEDVGIFAGATGGFAAGEKGVKQFVRDGDIKLRTAGAPARQQASPVALAGLLAAAGAGGGRQACPLQLWLRAHRMPAASLGVRPCSHASRRAFRVVRGACIVQCVVHVLRPWPTPSQTPPAPLQAPINESTKGAIIAVALVLGGSGLIAAGRAAALALQARISSNAEALMATGGVWVTTFMAARAALEM